VSSYFAATNPNFSATIFATVEHISHLSATIFATIQEISLEQFAVTAA